MRAWNALLILSFAVTAMAGCVSTDTPESDLLNEEALALPEIPLLDGAALVAHIQTFSETYPDRNSNGENHNTARDYLADELLAAGLVVARQTFEAPPSRTSTPANVESDPTLQNIYGIKWGVERDSFVIIGGHYDVTDAAVYGAYDDGSGTIMTLQLAQVYAELETQKTIIFTMFDGEEQGLRGSQHMVQSIQDGTFLDELVYVDGTPEADQIMAMDTTDDLFAMVDLDMIGINYPSKSPIYFDDNSDEIRNTVDTTRLDIGIPDEGFKFTGITLGRSDYAPFEDAGVPIAFFISAFEEVCPNDVACTPPSQCVQVDADTGRCAGASYPFWHRYDTVEGMELMAGGRDKLEAGFGNAARLASELLFWLSMTEDLELTVRDA